MEIEPRSYGKSELAMLYFPKSDPSAALKRLYRAQNEAYKIEKTKKWEKSMNDRELER